VRVSGDPLEVTTDRERTVTLVSSIYQLLGRPGLWSIAEQLRAQVAAAGPRGSARLPITRAAVSGMGTVSAVRNETVAVADLWDDEVDRLDSVISAWLVAVEDRATAIALARLRASRANALEARDRYFAGLPPATVLDRRLPLRGGTLTEAARDLRPFLRDVAALRIEAREALRRFVEMAQPHVDRPPMERVDAARREAIEQIAVVHRFVADAARPAPLLHWIVDWEAEPVIDFDRRGGTDDELAERIRSILRRCWEASWTVNDRVSAMPARTTAGGGEGTPEERVGETLSDEDEGGVWRFAPVVTRALDDLGWSWPSPQATAVSRVMEHAGDTWNSSFAFAAGSVALSVAVHVVFPPAGAVVDLVIGTVNLVATMAQAAERRTEFAAVFDQREALVEPPTGQDVAAALVALVASPYEGMAGVVANALPVVVQVWTPASPASRP
jgi:hypothetical protein